MKKYQIKKSQDHSLKKLLSSTVSAQIHMLCFVLALVGLGYILASPKISGLSLLACCVFVVAGAATMFISSSYHFMSDGYHISDGLENLLHKLDHFSIYIFIAGSYTPFLLKCVQEPWQTRLLWAVWATAAFGIAYTYYKKRLPNWAQSRIVYTGVYLFMGWILLFRIQEIWDHLSAYDFNLLLAGGLSYSVGALIYAFKRPNPLPKIFGFHEIWHVAVGAGFAIHYALIWDLYAF